MYKTKTVSLNFGPQHPAAHGVLRLIVLLKNEFVVNCDPHIGLLHRGSEKLIETKIFVNSLPYFDRMDYVSTLLQEHAFTLNIEHTTNNNITNISIIKTRTVFDELTRILNHYLAVSCHALDVGSMSTVFWAFEDREKIMEFYENISGARMHTALYKPLYYNNKVLSNSLKLSILKYLNQSRITLNEIHNVLSLNKVWKLRLKNIGYCNVKLIKNYSLTGVLARSSGLKRDIRNNIFLNYNNYFFINFKSFFSKSGDSYSRFILRLLEVNESLNIINQNINSVGNNITLSKDIALSVFNKNTNMESMIEHFKYWSSGFKVTNNIFYKPIESSKGEFGVTLLTNSSNKPYRCKVRSPSFFNLLTLITLSKSLVLADLVTLIGTIDIVFGEVDR